VRKAIDCQVFEDQVEALARGELPDEAVRLLRAHGDSCPECATLLGVQEHLVSPGLAELEEEVPAELLATVWPVVREGAAAAGALGAPGRPVRDPSLRAPRFRAWIPALAAASVVLLLGNGVLLSRLRQSQDREEVLAQRLLEQEGRVSPTVSTGLESRRSGLLGREGAAGWAAALGGEDVSVGELRALLESVPGNPTVLSATQVDALLGAARLWAPASLRAATAELRGEEGVRARDLLHLLQILDLSPEQTIPTSRLRDLLS